MGKGQSQQPWEMMKNKKPNRTSLQTQTGISHIAPAHRGRECFEVHNGIYARSHVDINRVKRSKLLTRYGAMATVPSLQEITSPKTNSDYVYGQFGDYKSCLHKRQGQNDYVDRVVHSCLCNIASCLVFISAFPPLHCHRQQLHYPSHKCTLGNAATLMPGFHVTSQGVTWFRSEAATSL